MSKRRSILAILLAGTLSFATACTGGSDTAEPSPATESSQTPAEVMPEISGPPLDAPLAEGDTVPDYSAPALGGGGTVAWADREGKPAVLTVWASWCPHCQVELPVLQAVANDYPGVHVTSVATATGQNPGPTPQDYVAANNITFPVAVDDNELTLLRGLGVQGFPTIYFVNADGTVYATAEGEVAEEDLRSAFEALASQTSAAVEGAEPIVVELAVKGGKVSGNTEPEIPVGKNVVVRVTADVSDEVHIHGYDVMGEVSPGSPAELGFTADAPGRFEVELEGAGLQLAEITVGP